MFNPILASASQRTQGWYPEGSKKRGSRMGIWDWLPHCPADVKNAVLVGKWDWHKAQLLKISLLGTWESCDRPKCGGTMFSQTVELAVAA